MELQCRTCKTPFKNDNPNLQVCPDCYLQIKEMLKSDKEFLSLFLQSDQETRKKFVEEILKDNSIKFQFLEGILDDVILTRIAKSVFMLKAKSVGLEGSGTIADFFR